MLCVIDEHMPEAKADIERDVSDNASLLEAFFFDLNASIAKIGPN